MKSITQIQSIEEYKALLHTSNTHPVLLFKFSPICPISFYAEEQFNTYVTQSPQKLKAYRVDVIKSKSVSQYIAKHLGVTHQSPQTLLLSEGLCVWHDSHNSLTIKEFELRVNKLINKKLH
jgi:bacillithiol system protein YtxJ